MGGGGQSTEPESQGCPPSHAADPATALRTDPKLKNGAMPFKIQVKLRGDAPDLFRGKIGPQFSGAGHRELCVCNVSSSNHSTKMVRFDSYTGRDLVGLYAS